MKNSFKIFHNPKCSKSKEALKILNDKNITMEVVDYLKVGLSKEDISLFFKSGLTQNELIRKKEKEFKSLKFEICDQKSCEKALLAFPKLLERPIIIANNKAIIARPAVKIYEII